MICSRCKQDKDISQFWKKTNSKTGYNSWCKNCCRESARISNKTNKDLLKGQLRNIATVQNKLLKQDNKRVCSCGVIFEVNAKSSIRCKECEKEKGKRDREKHKEREKKRRKAYYEANKEEIKLKRREKYKMTKV